jgi:hypothetical protein
VAISTFLKDIEMPTVCVWTLVLVVCLGASATLAQEELDNSKFKLQLNTWVSLPSGYFSGRSGDGYFDIQRDFGFGNYAT